MGSGWELLFPSLGPVSDYALRSSQFSRSAHCPNLLIRALPPEGRPWNNIEYDDGGGTNVFYQIGPRPHFLEGICIHKYVFLLRKKPQLTIASNVQTGTVEITKTNSGYNEEMSNHGLVKKVLTRHLPAKQTLSRPQDVPSSTLGLSCA